MGDAGRDALGDQTRYPRAAEFGALYGSFLRTGDPGSRWPRFDAESETVLWFGKTVEAEPHLLTPEREILIKAGITDVATLEQKLAHNTRSALNVPHRAYPPRADSPRNGAR